MKNYVQPGNVVTVIAPAGGVTSGQVVVIGSIAGIATATVAAGAELELAVEGVFDVAKVTADNLTAGSVAKVTPATGIIGAAGTTAVGWVLTAAGAGTTSARVRLTPGIAPTATTLLETETHKAAPKHHAMA